MKPFKPMLAVNANLDNLTFPLLASAKLDGIRAIVRNGVVMSRTLKPIPNKYVQARFCHLEHFDGELIVGEPTDAEVYRNTVSHVMAHDKTDFPVSFIVFDHIEQPGEPYAARLRNLPSVVETGKPYAGVNALQQFPINNLEQLFELETSMLRLGYEGLILRNATAPYKYGRSTAKEGYLLKLKRFTDAEATVTGFEERMRNDNVATIDELGHTKRSSHQANKVGHGDLGALVCDFKGEEVKVGTGFSAEERKDIWSRQQSVLGKLVKFKYFDYGVKDAPRHPVFLGWRDPIDI